MATISALSTANRRKLRTHGFENFVNSLQPLTSDVELVLVVKVDSDDGDIHITHFSDMSTIVQAIANSGSDSGITVSRSAGGVLSATT